MHKVDIYPLQRMRSGDKEVALVHEVDSRYDRHIPYTSDNL